MKVRKRKKHKIATNTTNTATLKAPPQSSSSAVAVPPYNAKPQQTATDSAPKQLSNTGVANDVAASTKDKPPTNTETDEDQQSCKPQATENTHESQSEAEAATKVSAENAKKTEKDKPKIQEENSGNPPELKSIGSEPKPTDSKKVNNSETATAKSSVNSETASLNPPPLATATSKPSTIVTLDSKAQQQKLQATSVTGTSASATTGREPNKFVQGSNANEKVLEVKALREDGRLDVYAYHRGREGMEPRDEATGDLLCDLPVTDSNGDVGEPKLTTQIEICFPLTDDKDLPPSKIPMYKDTISWDLGDPETPTPMAFAIDVAENFGLTFAQTTDLAQSVQRQIYAFVSENCGYAVPVALSDGAGVERTNFPQPTYPYLYGDAFAPVDGPLAGRICAQTKARSKASSKSKSRGPNTAWTGSTSRRVSATVEERQPLVDAEQDIEQKYLDEVTKRMIQYSKDDVLAKAQDPSSIGAIELKKDYHCHICHKRHSVVGQFPCNHVSHTYCSGHLKVRTQ